MSKPDPELERLARAAAESRGRNPAAVLAAFVPSGELTFDMQALIRLERLGSPLLTGGTPRLADLLIAYCAVTDWHGLEAAWRKNKLDAYLDEFTAGRPASGISRITEAVTEAISAAFAPAAAAETSDPEKKTPPPDAVGGSTSSRASATTTAGHPPAP